MNLGVANRPGAARQGRGAGLGFCADLPFRLAGVVPKSIQSSGAHADILNTTTRPLCTSPDRRKAPGGCHLAKKRTLPPLRSLSDSNSGKSSSSSDDRRFGSSSYGGGTEGSSSTFPASGSLPSRLEDTDPTSLEAACRTVDSIWRLVAEGRQEELLQFIPDEVIDAVAELRQQQLQLRGSAAATAPVEVSFADVCVAAAANGPSTAAPGAPASPAPTSGLGPGPLAPSIPFTFDTFAQRHVLFASDPELMMPPGGEQLQQQQRPPGSMTGAVAAGSRSTGTPRASRGAPIPRPLSAMRLGPNRAVVRYAVGATGSGGGGGEGGGGGGEEGGGVGYGSEQAVLTFTLENKEVLEPSYRGACIRYAWQLVGVSGEAARGTAALEEGGGPAAAPHPSLPPEAVVEAQLAALRSQDDATVFRFASPSNRAVTGPLSRFSTLLRNPMYRPLLGHRAASTHRRLMLGPDAYCEVVRIVSDNTGLPQAVEALYRWDVRRRPRRQGTGGALAALQQQQQQQEQEVREEREGLAAQPSVREGVGASEEAASAAGSPQAAGSRGTGERGGGLADGEGQGQGQGQGQHGVGLRSSGSGGGGEGEQGRLQWPEGVAARRGWDEDVDGGADCEGCWVTESVQLVAAKALGR